MHSLIHKGLKNNSSTTGPDGALEVALDAGLNVSLMIMMMNCFCGMVDQQKAFSLISSQDHCQRSSPSRISDTAREGFKSAQNMSSSLVE